MERSVLQAVLDRTVRGNSMVCWERTETSLRIVV